MTWSYLILRAIPVINERNALRDDIKNSGKFAIFSYLKIEGGGGLRLITEKCQLKIKTIHYIEVKMTQNDL